jgi:hypothetical protein
MRCNACSALHRIGRASLHQHIPGTNNRSTQQTLLMAPCARALL